MPRSIALTHLVRQDDGTSHGVWAGHVLRSAFQPIFAFFGDKLEIVAQEGLLRAFRDGEPVAPLTFFGTIPALDRLHVETLTRTLHLLNAAACLEDDQSVFVNFNPSVFTDRAIADVALRDMRLVLHEAGIDAERVVCEVTEQRSASPETLHDFVEALRSGGFRIAVDDYGAHNSDIARVTDLDPDIVKFDAQWITRLLDTDPGHKLLSTMVGTFEERGVRTVVEGIEEPWQIDLAREAGVSMLQGYALARPELAVARGAKAPAEVHVAFDAIPVAEFSPPPVLRFGQKTERTFGKRSAAQ